MNQSLINELRALDLRITKQIHMLDAHWSENPVNYKEATKLLLAKSNCLNGIAVLVAAKKR